LAKWLCEFARGPKNLRYRVGHGLWADWVFQDFLYPFSSTGKRISPSGLRTKEKTISDELVTKGSIYSSRTDTFKDL